MASRARVIPGCPATHWMGSANVTLLFIIPPLLCREQGDFAVSPVRTVVARGSDHDAGGEWHHGTVRCDLDSLPSRDRRRSGDRNDPRASDAHELVDRRLVVLCDAEYHLAGTAVCACSRGMRDAVGSATTSGGRGQDDAFCLLSYRLGRRDLDATLARDRGGGHAGDVFAWSLVGDKVVGHGLTLLGVDNAPTGIGLRTDGLDLREPFLGQTLPLIPGCPFALATRPARAASIEGHETLLQTVDDGLVPVEVRRKRLRPVLAASRRDPAIGHRRLDGLRDTSGDALGLV